jgi:hypothetical protein
MSRGRDGSRILWVVDMRGGPCGTTRCDARWSMVAIDDSIGGAGHSEQEVWTI